MTAGLHHCGEPRRDGSGSLNQSRDRRSRSISADLFWVRGRKLSPLDSLWNADPVLGLIERVRADER